MDSYLLKITTSKKTMVIVHLTTSGIFAFFLARQPQDVLLHRFPPVKPCANENVPYPLVTLRLCATCCDLETQQERKKAFAQGLNGGT
jgi:hypothetical protein